MSKFENEQKSKDKVIPCGTKLFKINKIKKLQKTSTSTGSKKWQNNIISKGQKRKHQKTTP